MERTFSSREKIASSFLAVSLALGAGACSGSGKAPTPAEAKGTGTPTSTSSDGELPTLVFDDLLPPDIGNSLGGSSVVKVYESPTSEVSNGTYFDGDEVPAICQQEGGEVSSDPSVGEYERTSDDWFLIKGAPGEKQYATAVYVEDPSTLLDQLPEC